MCVKFLNLVVELGGGQTTPRLVNPLHITRIQPSNTANPNSEAVITLIGAGNGPLETFRVTESYNDIATKL